MLCAFVTAQEVKPTKLGLPFSSIAAAAGLRKYYFIGCRFRFSVVELLSAYFFGAGFCSWPHPTPDPVLPI